jgi:hypothetical protein
VQSSTVLICASQLRKDWDMKSELGWFWLKLLLVGATSFWLPDVIVHALARYSFSRTHVMALTAVLPICFTCAYVIVKRRYRTVKTFVALPMLIGLWTCGGLFMTVGASSSGGGFAGPSGLRETVLVMLMSFFPPITFMMATYDGTLFALLLATVAPLVVWLFLRGKQDDPTQNAVAPS